MQSKCFVKYILMNKLAIYLRKRNSAIFILFIVSLILTGYAIVKITGSSLGDEGWYDPITLCSILWITCFVIAALTTFKHIYLFSSAYLTALIMFHLGLFYQRSFGETIFSWSWERGSFSPWLESAGWHINLALAAFGIGFSVAIFTGKFYRRDVDKQAIERAKKAAHWSSVGLMLASLIFFLFAFKSYGNLLNYARHELFSSHADSRGFGAFMMIFPGSVLCYFFSAITLRQNIFGTVLAVFVFLMFMITGYRSAALFPALVGVALWVKSGRRLPLPVVACGVVVVLILIAASGYLRTMGKYSELDINDVSKALNKARIKSSISEIGASVNALASVLQLVPKVDDYRYGSSYVISIIDAFPNIGLNINIEESREYAVRQRFSDADAVRQMRPADWLTYRIAPWHFSKGYGVGFSAIAEPFLNFGTTGVLVFFVLLGYALGRLDCVPLFRNPYLFIFCTTMLWPLIRTVRNDSSNFFKPVAFTLLILLFWWGISRMFLNKKI